MADLKRLAMFSCAINVFITIAAGLIILFAVLSTLYTQPDIDAVTQITEDWERRPFVEISVDDWSCGWKGKTPVFHRLWSGTEEGCYERNLFFRPEVLTRHEWDLSSYSGNNGTCDEIDNVWSINQTEFYD